VFFITLGNTFIAILTSDVAGMTQGNSILQVISESGADTFRNMVVDFRGGFATIKALGLAFKPDLLK